MTEWVCGNIATAGPLPLHTIIPEASTCEMLPTFSGWRQRQGLGQSSTAAARLHFKLSRVSSTTTRDFTSYDSADDRW